MKRKTVLLFALAALLIAGAFAAPPLLLRAGVAQSAGRSYLADASSYMLKPAENTVEKLRVFADAEKELVPIGRPEKQEQIAQQLQQELKTLYELGAIDQAYYYLFREAAGGELNADRICVIEPKQFWTFEVYHIRLWEVEAQFILDADTGKILSLNYVDYYGAAEVGDEALAERELNAWAAYYDLTPGRIDFTAIKQAASKDHGLPETGVCKQILLTDSAGNAVAFGQCYDDLSDYIAEITWCAIP